VQSRRNQQSGYTLAEILVVLAISTVIMILCYDMIDDAMRTSLFVESHNNLSQWAQRPVNVMQTEVYQNKVVFDSSNAQAAAYLTRFTTPPAYPGAYPACGGGGCGGPAAALPTFPAMQANSMLPILEPSNVMAPDAGIGAQRMTGNILFIVRQLPPVMIPYDHDSNAGTPNVNFPADRYRFEMFYLTRDTTRPFGSAGYYVDLIQARSIDFADRFQLDPLINCVSGAGSCFTAAQKTTIVNGLTAANIRVAWDPMNQPVTTAFYNVSNTGALTLQAGQGIWLFSSKSLIPELKGPAISGKVLFSVAFRPTSTTTYPIRDVVPKYAAYDATTPAFPSGFEVKVVGAGAARKVLVRLVLMSNYKAGKYESQEGFVISSS
jgi:prepilin-type N-terminal cleavage/methylation domain-containing protein